MKHIFASNDEKVTEKAFSQGVVISVVSILLCLVALCSMTYAWFSGDVSSGGNTVISGSFDISISVVKTDGATVTASEGAGEGTGTVAVTEVEGRDGVWSCQLPGAGTYTVTLTMSPESTVKGHCIVKVGNGAEQRTEAILNANCENPTGRPLTDPFVFTITVEGETTVTFESRWGEAAHADIAPIPVSGEGGN